VAKSPLELARLTNENAILNAICSGDQRSPFIVKRLDPNLLAPENIYCRNADAIFHQASSRILSGLALEAGSITLAKYINDNRPYEISLIQRAHILQAVLNAIEFLHNSNIVHFDLKPENIVLFSDTWKLIDFESSFDLRSLPTPTISNSTSILVTVEYAAPEVAKVMNASPSIEIAVTPAMDIWSLGMVGLFIFTGCTLWPHLHPSEMRITPSLVEKVEQDQITAAINNMLRFRPKELSFLEGCLCYEPRDRLESSVLKDKSLFRFDQAAKESHDLFERMEDLLHRLHDDGHELNQEMYSNIEKLLTQPKERIEG
jgi:serine/threonine protein kinase